MAAWKNGPYAELMNDISYYSNQWYVVDDNVAVGIGSYGQYIVFNRETGVAIAKFSTYSTGQDIETTTKDLAWLIDMAQSL